MAGKRRKSGGNRPNDDSQPSIFDQVGHRHRAFANFFRNFLRAVLVYSVQNLVALPLGVEVMNALLLPLVLGFLVTLAIKALPAEHRLRGAYLWLVIAVAGLTAALGVYGGLSNLPGL